MAKIVSAKRLELSTSDTGKIPTLQEKQSLRLSHTQRYTGHTLNIENTVIIARRTTNLRRRTSEANNFFFSQVETFNRIRKIELKTFCHVTSIIRVHVKITSNNHHLIKAARRLRKPMSKFKILISARHLLFSTKTEKKTVGNQISYYGKHS